MGEFDLEESVKFSDSGVVSTNLFDSQKACVNFLCLSEGQTALEDTSDQKVIVIINTGSGSITVEEGERDVEEGTLLLFESGERRSLKAKTKLTALMTTIRGK